MQHAAGVGWSIVRHICMYVGHERIACSRPVSSLEIRVVPVDGLVEKSRVPTTVCPRAAATAACTLFHQAIDEFFVFGIEALLRELFLRQSLKRRYRVRKI